MAKSPAVRKSDQRTRDRAALDAWIDAGCPVPSVTKITRSELLKWIRENFCICPLCKGGGRVENTHGEMMFCIPCNGTGKLHA